MDSIPSKIDLSTIPVAAPPPGMSSNFVDPQSLATTTMGIGVLMLFLTAAVVIVRIFSNYHATRGLGWDDCSCTIAAVLFLIYVGISLDIRQAARHDYDIPILWITPSEVKKLYVQSITSGPLIFFAKLSLLMLYYRLFKTQKFIRLSIAIATALSFILYLSNMTVVGVLCAPKVGHPWDLTTVAKCSGSAIFGFVLGIANMALDTFLLVLPIPVILSLQLSVKKKIGVLVIFMVGFFALIASIVSLVYRTKLWQGTDSSWNGFVCVICTIVETGVTIICSSTSALVTFWKSHIVTHAALIYSRLCSRYGAIATRVKCVSRTSCETQTSPPESDQSDSYPSLHNLNYVQLDKYHEGSTRFSGNTVEAEIVSGSPKP